MNPIETIQYRGYTINIHVDQDAPHPLKDCGTPFNYHCVHQKYDLGNASEPPEANDIKLPIYLYDHSGIAISIIPFSCIWDSGLLGYIYISKADALSEFGTDDEELICQKMRCDIETYSQYLEGSVYGYIVDDVESCWGYYGGDHEKSGLLESARTEIDLFISDKLSAHLKRLGAWIRNEVPMQYRYAM